MSEVKDTLSERLVVLLIDDDSAFRTRLCRAFRERGWNAHEAGGSQQALELTATTSPDLVLLDLKMPEVNGLDLIEAIKKLDSTVTLIILTGYGSIATALQALKLGADHYIGKPVDVEQIIAAYEELQTDSGGKTVPATVPTLGRVEWEHIQRVLSDCAGNITQAAKLLGVHRRSLQRKLAKYPPGR
jgi:two-component system, response regulator RegA